MTASHEDPLVGQILAARYRVLRKLGEGAMGAVYLAEHIHMGRKDAIKVLRENLASDREAIRRFERGARNVSAIRHTNVCTIYDFAETGEGGRFLAMEYIEGPTLKDVLDEQGSLPLARAVDIAAQTAEGLDAAHDSGIVHRDLKPGNIMLLRGKGGTDVVKVVDFDIAKGTEGGEEVTRLGFVIGTPEYMSPEQLMGEELDRRSDVYSLALVLVRMITGGLPFRAEGTQDVMIARLTSQPLTLAEMRPDVAVPEGIQRALDRALQRKAADRQADALEFAHEIRAALAGAHAGTQAAPMATTIASRPAPPPDLPATRVEPAKGMGFAVGAAGAPAPKRNVLLFGGLVMGVLAVSGIVWVLIQDRNGANGNTGPIEIPPAATSPAVPPSTPPSGPDTGTGVTPPPPPPGPPPAPPPGPPPAAEITFASDAAISDYVLDASGRVFASGRPPQAELLGLRDSLTAAFRQSSNPQYRAAAARVLVYVEDYRGNATACRRWFDEVRNLGGNLDDIRSLCGNSP